jgi:hypothetical protein
MHRDVQVEKAFEIADDGMQGAIEIGEMERQKCVNMEPFGERKMNSPGI